jgi:hypothetical protein
MANIVVSQRSSFKTFKGAFMYTSVVLTCTAVAITLSVFFFFFSKAHFRILAIPLTILSIIGSIFSIGLITSAPYQPPPKTDETIGTTFDSKRPGGLIGVFKVKAYNSNHLCSVALAVYGDTATHDTTWQQPGYILPNETHYRLSSNTLRDMEEKIGRKEITGLTCFFQDTTVIAIMVPQNFRNTSYFKKFLWPDLVALRY